MRWRQELTTRVLRNISTSIIAAIEEDPETINRILEYLAKPNDIEDRFAK